MLAITYSGANIHVAKQATPTMAPVIMLNDITSRLLNGSTMDSSQIAILQLTGISKQDSHIHIFSKMNTAPLISLGVLCDYGCTITLDK